jgi:hypothetical protein
MQDSAEADSTTGQTSVPATVNTTSVAGTKNSNKKSAQQRHSENGFEEWVGLKILQLNFRRIPAYEVNE